MPTQDEKPLGAAKPKTSNSSTPVYDPGDEWFEDALIRAGEKYLAKHPPAK